jgi:hemoglobin-like flavoprotein
MDLQSCRRIAESYDQIAHLANRMVTSFYEKFFRACPEVRALFREDMTIQKEHLAATLALVARNIEHLDILQEPIMLLGIQHVGFGARAHQYLIVRDLLLEALAEVLGDKWTDQLRADWYEALNLIIELMLRGGVVAATEEARRGGKRFSG